MEINRNICFHYHMAEVLSSLTKAPLFLLRLRPVTRLLHGHVAFVTWQKCFLLFAKVSLSFAAQEKYHRRDVAIMVLLSHGLKEV